MYLNAERIAIANKAIHDTFEQTSVAWQAIPHWDTGDPAQTRVRSDSAYAADNDPGPLGEAPVAVETFTRYFYLTVAQAISPTPDALLDAVIARTVQLAAAVDKAVIGKLVAPNYFSTSDDPGYLMNALIDARAVVERFGYRAPSCLLTDTGGLKAISKLDAGFPVLKPLLEAANVNSRYRVDTLELLEDAKEAEKDKKSEKADEAKKPVVEGKILLLGRRQRIAHGGAAATAPGEEPVDLAISVSPSLEVIGETSGGNIELAVRIRLAARITDKNGIVGVVIS
jgi:hypothetical protein